MKAHTSVYLYRHVLPLVLKLAGLLRSFALAAGSLAILAVALAGLAPSPHHVAAPPSPSRNHAVAGTHHAPDSAETVIQAGAQTSSASGLYAWSVHQGQWKLAGAGMLDSARINHGIVPLMLRIDGLTPGATYELTLVYRDCESGLTSLRGAGPSWRPMKSAPGGPGRGHPDASLLVPESHTAGRRGERLELWGGTFHDSRDESHGALPCAAQRQLGLTLSARATTIFLMWAGYVPAPDGGECVAITAHLDSNRSNVLSALDCPSATFQ